MQLFLGAVPIILRLFSKAIEDTYYSQIIPRIICQSLHAKLFIQGDPSCAAPLHSSV